MATFSRRSDSESSGNDNQRGRQAAIGGDVVAIDSGILHGPAYAGFEFEDDGCCRDSPAAGFEDEGSGCDSPSAALEDHWSHGRLSAGFEDEGSCCDSPSAAFEDHCGLEDESRKLDSAKGDGSDTANVSLLPLDQVEGSKKKEERKEKEGEGAVEGSEKEEEPKEQQEGDEQEEMDGGEQEASLGEKVKEGDEGEEAEKEEKQGEVEMELRSDRERANRNALLFLSGLFVLAMPIVVWSSISQPLHIVWRLSVLLCGCSVIWSRLLGAAMSLQTMLLFFCSAYMVALYADATLDPKMGFLIAHLNSHFAAGMLGYALAEHRQRNGTEVAATTAAVGHPSDEKEANRLIYFQMLGGLYIALFTLGAVVWVAWVVCNRADYPTQHLLANVFLPLSGALIFWILFVAGMILHGALIEETGLCLLLMYMVSLVLLYTLVAMLTGDIAAMAFFSLGVLGYSGFFGYSLCVYASFKLRLKLVQLHVKVAESKAEAPLRSLVKKPDESTTEVNAIRDETVMIR